MLKSAPLGKPIFFSSSRVRSCRHRTSGRCWRLHTCPWLSLKFEQPVRATERDRTNVNITGIHKCSFEPRKSWGFIRFCACDCEASCGGLSLGGSPVDLPLVSSSIRFVVVVPHAGYVQLHWQCSAESYMSHMRGRHCQPYHVQLCGTSVCQATTPWKPEPNDSP